MNSTSNIAEESRVKVNARLNISCDVLLDAVIADDMRALLTSSGLRMTGNTDGGSVVIDAL